MQCANASDQYAPFREISILMCVNAAFSIYMNEEEIERHKSILHFLECIIVFKAIAFLHS